MFYDNNKCDGCGLIMHDNEDIVVCPVCGTPQHRECYNKENKCVNEHLHAEGFKWKAEVEPEKPKAEAQNEHPKPNPISNTPIIQVNGQNAESIFMRNVLYDPNDEFDGIKVREAAVFCQQGSVRYIKKFMQAKKTNKKLTWNWAAFFLTPFWFFYRKLYKAGLLFLCVSVALTIAVSTYSEKVIDACPEFETAVTDYVQEIENSYSAITSNSDTLLTEQNKIIELSRANGHILVKIVAVRVGVLLAQSIAAALLADYLLKKRLTQIVHLSREIKDNNAKVYAIARSGGVSYTMTLLSLVVSMYLPDIIYLIADKINF